MPISRSFRGSITVKGINTKSDEEYLFNDTIEVSSDTVGGCFDNLIEAADLMTSRISLWTLTNQSMGSSDPKEYWFLEISHPEILRSQVSEPSSSVFNEEITFPLRHPEGVLLYLISKRHKAISSALRELKLISAADSSLPSNPSISKNNISGNLSSEKRLCGYTGVELDNIIEISRSEGRLDLYRLKIEDSDVSREKRLKADRFLRKIMAAKLRVRKFLKLV